MDENQTSFQQDYNNLGIRTNTTIPFDLSPQLNNAGVKDVVGTTDAQTTQFPVSPAGNIESSTSVGYNVGVGWWLGFDGGTPKFFVGNASGHKMLWDGESLTISGDLTADTLTIGGGISITVSPGDNLQDALDRIATAGAGRLLLSAGTYVQNTGLVGPSNIVIEGFSSENTVIDFNNTSANLSFTGTNVYTIGTITSITSGVYVTGNGTSWLTNASAGQYLFLDTRWYKIYAITGNTTLILAEPFSDASVSFPGAAYRIATIKTGVWMDKLSLKNSTGTALVFTDTRYTRFQDINTYTSNKGLVFTNSSHSSMDTIYSVGNASNGIEFNNVSITQLNALVSYGNGGHGVVVNNSRAVPITNSSCQYNTGDGWNFTDVIGTPLSASEGSANGSQGLEFVSGCSGNILTSSEFRGNTSDGVKLTGTDDNITFGSVTLASNGGYGINISAASDNNTIITTCNFSGNTSGACNDSGTGTVIRGNVGLMDNTNSSSPITLATLSLPAGEAITALDPVRIADYQPNGTGLTLDTSDSGEGTDANPSKAITVGNNPLRCCIAFIGGPSLGFASVTYGGQAMTSITSATNGDAPGSRKMAVFFLKDPPTGSNTFTYDSGGVGQYTAWSFYSFYGAYNMTYTPASASGQTGAFSLSSTPAFSNSRILAASMGNAAYSSPVNMATLKTNDNGSDLFFISGDAGNCSANTTQSASGGGGNAFVQIVLRSGGTHNSGFYRANSTDAAHANAFVGFANNNYATDVTATAGVAGIMPGFSGLTVGGEYYLTDTNGVISTTPGIVTRKIGLGASTTQVLITNIW